MKQKFLLLFLLLAGFDFQVKAERVKSTAEIFDTPYASQPVAWLDRGAEVWIDGISDNNSRIKIYTKVWVKRKDMTRSTAKANAVLHDIDGNVIGGIYLPQSTIHDTSSPFSSHVLIFRGYIFKDRIDAKSIPEPELIKILDPKKSKVDTSDMNAFIKNFRFKQTQDTLGFAIYEMSGKDGPRMGLAFRDNRLVAVIPTNGFKPKFFEAELHQASLHVVYLEKLSPEEESLFVDLFNPR